MANQAQHQCGERICSVLPGAAWEETYVNICEQLAELSDCSKPICKSRDGASDLTGLPWVCVCVCETDEVSVQWAKSVLPWSSCPNTGITSPLDLKYTLQGGSRQTTRALHPSDLAGRAGGVVSGYCPSPCAPSVYAQKLLWLKSQGTNPNSHFHREPKGVSFYLEAIVTTSSHERRFIHQAPGFGHHWGRHSDTVTITLGSHRGLLDTISALWALDSRFPMWWKALAQRSPSVDRTHARPSRSSQPRWRDDLPAQSGFSRTET